MCLGTTGEEADKTVVWLAGDLSKLDPEVDELGMMAYKLSFSRFGRVDCSPFIYRWVDLFFSVKTIKLP